MSLSSRDERAKARAKRKAAYLAAFAGKIGSAENAAPDDDGRSIRRFNANKHRHVIANCGNVGCERCHPPSTPPRTP